MDVGWNPREEEKKKEPKSGDGERGGEGRGVAKGGIRR